MITCQLCNRQFERIHGRHLKSAHNIDFLEYTRLFPDAPTCSTEMRQRMSEAISRSLTDDVRQRISESLQGHAVSDETRSRISEANCGNTNFLGHHHSEESKRLIRKANEGRTLSEGACRKISESLIGNTRALGHTVSEESRRVISESLTGRKVSVETSRRMSEALTGQTRTEEQKRNISVGISRSMTPEVRRRISETLMGHPPAFFSEEARRKISETHTEKVPSDETLKLLSESRKESWKDPEYQRHQMESWHTRPTQPELYVQKTLDKHFPGEWEYTGDGRVWLDGRNPDFMNVNGKKQVIEVFGMFWHEESEEAERIVHYKKLGFDCLVIWEYDTLNEDLVVESVKNLGT